VTDADVDTAAAIRQAPPWVRVGASWRPAGNGSEFAVEDPATGETLAMVADATPADGRAALDAAADAFPAWRRTAPRARGDVLRRAFELVSARAEVLGVLISLEMGKPLADARAEVSYAADYLRWYAEEAVRIHGRFGSNETGRAQIVTAPQPVGPCLFVTPWNFPLAMGARKLAPALAAGCTTIVKPAPQTPLSMLALAAILVEAGAPSGTVNVLPSSRTAALVRPLLRDPRLRKLSFTGSTSVGRLLIAQSADQVLRVSMELGGNAPFLVFEDADLDAAVDGAMIAKIRNVGQACTAANRFLVHRSIAAEFGDRLARRMARLRIGHGVRRDTEVGPLIDADAREATAALVQDACRRGARSVIGGHAVDGPGWFYAPTVLTEVPEDARLLREEIFGPVAPIVAFDHEDDAVASANATDYGLAAYVYSRDIGRAFRVADALEVGMVGLNTGAISDAGAPFGGVKHSGYGREGGPEGLHDYLQTKYLNLPS
jgi:succinate-semialdehyde dehydrogenase / glutarate-semialdehyde dehydrogenase